MFKLFVKFYSLIDTVTRWAASPLATTERSDSEARNRAPNTRSFRVSCDPTMNKKRFTCGLELKG